MLRELRMEALAWARERAATTGNEVDAMGLLDPKQFDERNVRRRVYDALNVLMAIGVIERDKATRKIVWKGLPAKRRDEQDMLEVRGAERQPTRCAHSDYDGNSRSPSLRCRRLRRRHTAPPRCCARRASRPRSRPLPPPGLTPRPAPCRCPLVSRAQPQQLQQQRGRVARCGVQNRRPRRPRRCHDVPLCCATPRRESF